MPDALYARNEAVGVVTLNRPERLNAMNGGLMAAFDAALRQAIADPECAVIVITGATRGIGRAAIGRRCSGVRPAGRRQQHKDCEPHADERITRRDRRGSRAAVVGFRGD